MTFLPIVGRELRVASRKRVSFWVRMIVALVGLAIAAGCLFLSQIQGLGTVRMGDVLFKVLTWIALAGALSAGLFFTSDSLSEEKREGTIGFLFLTDLRGYDVVLGKLLATSLRTFYGMLALLPILAMTLLMGGVTGEQFFKSSLALINALFCSLIAGLLVSVVSRESQKAMVGTFLLMLALTAGGPLADSLYAWLAKESFGFGLSYLSPGYAFVAAAVGQPNYWIALLTSHAIAWVMLGLACAMAPRTWQEKTSKTAVVQGDRSYGWKYGSARRRESLRHKLLEKNPMLWLACRERWQSVGLWLLTVVVFGAFGILLAVESGFEIWFGWDYASRLFKFLIYVAMASQACRFFVEARRTGLIELLLASPLNEQQIVRGQAWALWRVFGFPVVLLLIVQLAGACLSHGAWRYTGIQLGGTGPAAVLILMAAGLSALTTAANLVAICAFGMWMGMTSKNTNQATLKTVLFVQVIPWFVISFLSSAASMMLIMPQMLQTAGAPPQIFAWFPVISAAVSASLTLGKDAAFYFWARKRLYSAFREQATRGIGLAPSVTRPSPAAPLPPPLAPAQP